MSCLCFFILLTAFFHLKAPDEDSPKEPFLVKIFDLPPTRREPGTIIYVTKADKCYRSSKDATTGDGGDSVLKSVEDVSEPKDTSHSFGIDGSIKNLEDLTAKTARESPVSFQDVDSSDGEDLASSSDLDAEWGELDKAEYSERSDHNGYTSDELDEFPEFDDRVVAIEAGMSCSEDNDDASFAENLGNDSDATDLDGFDFTDEEEDAYLDTTIRNTDENETIRTHEKDYHENATESQKQIYSQTENKVKKDGADLHDVSKNSMSKVDESEADDVRLEFLTELEEKYTQVRQLVFLVNNSEIQRTLIEVVRWIWQTHQRLQY